MIYLIKTLTWTFFKEPDTVTCHIMDNDGLIYRHIHVFPYHHFAVKNNVFVKKKLKNIVMKLFFSKSMQDRSFVSWHMLRLSVKSKNMTFLWKVDYLTKTFVVNLFFKGSFKNSAYVSWHMLGCTWDLRLPLKKFIDQWFWVNI